MSIPWQDGEAMTPDRAMESIASLRDVPLERSADVLVSELSDHEVVMLDIESGKYFGMERSARVIWDALATPVTLDELVALVRARYPRVDADVCERDTVEFVDDLIRHGLVVPHAGAAA